MAEPRNPRTGLTDAIRAQLSVDVPMTAVEVTEALERAGLDVEEKNVRSLLNQREAVGEFRKELVNHKVAFTLAPGWKRPRNAGVPSEPKRRNVKTMHLDLDHARRVVETIDQASSTASAPQAAVVAPAPVPEAPVARVAIAPVTRGMRERLDAIRQDIEDAIADACDAELPHALIKALVRAGGETRRAREQLVA